MPVLETGPPFYVVIQATRSSSRLLGKGSTLIFLSCFKTLSIGLSWSTSKLFLSKEQQATQILVIPISKNQALLCQININTYAFKEESLFKNPDSFHDYFYQLLSFPWN